MPAAILKKIGNIFYHLSKKIEQKRTTSHEPLESLQAIRVKPWFKDQGDKTLRLQYDLNEDSVVFDLGGYEGEWAAQILCLYNSSVYIFEPYEEYFKNIQSRFLHNKKVKIFQFGLSGSNQSATLAIADNSSSIFGESKDKVNINLVCAKEFFNRHNISRIDLMKINIEGGEYDFLEHIIETGEVNKVINIQVQFHDFIPDAESRMKAIQQKLRQTHYLTYQYEFVWENWKRKNS